TVVLKNGKVEKYDLDIPDEKAAFEKKYGDIIPTPPLPPVPVKITHEISAAQEINRSRIAHDFEITDNKAYMRLKDGTVEEYDLGNATERKKFEDKYGKLIGITAKVEGSLAPVTVIGVEGTRSVIAPVTVTGPASQRYIPG
ncbi:MAG TPA: hypothetical protein VI461_07430, partial [Chitinophagaceae bacterium]|nr:hypothetical protein [Chitinophagaceae bacterium]